MTVPWVNGTVDGVLADLRKTHQSSKTPSNPGGDTGLVYAAAVGMVTGLTGGHDKRPAAERMKDVTTVCAAIRRFEEEVWGS